MITKTDTLLSKALLDNKSISDERLQPFMDEAARSRDTLFQLLLKRGAVPEDTLLRSLSELLRVPYADLGAMKPDPAVIEKVPLKIAEYYKMVPLKIDKRKLTAAVSAPLDLRTQDDIRAHLGYEVDVVLAKEKDVQEGIKRFYGFAAGTIGEMMAQTPSTPAPAETQSYDKIENIEQMAGDASIAKLVNQIILEAYRKRASDIHIEPYRGKIKLRYRIDGILYNANVQPEMARFILPILSRIKIMSSLNIVERRLPQDGRAIVKVEDTQLDLRVSSIPTPYGESIVIRMLPMNRVFDLARLGLSADKQRTFEELIEKPHGIIFITGPTGSGKSTTLYACLNKINTDERKIITIEDPVEYEMDGVTQIQVVSSIGLDFARGLRSILRHDPDVIMVGEVRDLETAEIAIRVALTGHLVFSTLHTNDAASGITRLIDIGVQPYLVASSVEAFVAQRLVRTICPKCKEEDKSRPDELKKVIADEMGAPVSRVKIWRGRGCDDCNGSGFMGRCAIYEILRVDEELRRLIMRNAPASEIKHAAVRSGMRTLRQDGWQKVLDGTTTPEEILEVAEEDKDAAPAEAPETAPAPDGFHAKYVQALKAPAELKAKSFQDHGRFFVRLNQSVNIRYKVIQGPHGEEEEADGEGLSEAEFSFTKNISAGGLAFVANDAIAPGSILDLRIELPGHDKPIECLAKVMRVEGINVGKVHIVAVCFLDLSAALRAQLDKYVLKESK